MARPRPRLPPRWAAAFQPLSLTYTNDPNNLSKAKYVRGLLGISYDFGALKRLVEGDAE